MSVSVSTIYVGYDSRFPLAYEACERSSKKFAPNVVVKALKKGYKVTLDDGSVETIQNAVAQVYKFVEEKK